jgi:NADPH-dependent curcumin reductase CurA
MINRQVQLIRLPAPGNLSPADFTVAELPAAKPGAGEVLLRSIYLSLDPYVRGWMSGIDNYVYPAAPGRGVIGRAVSEVVESSDPRLKAGDFVFGETGWQTHPTVRGDAVEKIDTSLGPISTAVGVLGSPGLTAWVGMQDIGKPAAGDTVVVSAAAGAVGSVAGQIARIRGARVVGVAGSPDKCDFVVKDLGFDACVNHRSASLGDDLARACPDGINAYFDNTGGATTRAVFPLLAKRARVALCGLVAEYNDPNATGPSLKSILYKQASIQAFSVRENLHRMAEFRREVSGWMKSGRMRFREDMAQGIENTVAAFQGLLEGRNFGKLLVQVGEDPTRTRT